MNASCILNIGSPEELGVMRISKALKHQVLLDEMEMQNLFAFLDPFEIFVVSEPVTDREMRIDQEEFLDVYAGYIQTLKNGSFPDESSLRRYFSSAFTSSRDTL